MNLAQALRLSLSPSGYQSSVLTLALVGAGGKTSALFRLGRDLLVASPAGRGVPASVLLTTTTHLALSQVGMADRHFTVEDPAALAELEAGLPAGLILVTGAATREERVSSLAPVLLERLLALSRANRVPLLAEADGARQRLLKAPASHEPVIPEWVDQVVVVAGLAALGKPLTGDWVHRPVRFGVLAGLSMGESITLEALRKVLIHPEGGLKNIPPQARRVALLNQADTPQLQAQGFALARQLLPVYASVIVASLYLPGDRVPAPVYALHEPRAGILLAAGGSTRLGRPKQLLNWRGQPLVRTVAATALAAGLSPVVIVAGAEAEGVVRALEGLPVQIVHNADWEAGQSSSVRTGVEALPPETGAAVFLLADQPQIPASLVGALVERHATTLSPLVAPLTGGRRANPVLFDRRTFPDLLALTGDVGGRSLFARYPVEWVTWHDESILLDVDTQSDYQHLLELA
jgi:molybdenum cofactor cytidylyltransferase